MNIYVWKDVPVTEYIEYKMNADSSGNLYVPTAGVSTSGTAGCSYDWKVFVDGGGGTTYTGTGGSGSSITLSGYTAGTEHTIMIIPTTETYQRARAFGWNGTAGRTYLTEIISDSSYMGYGISDYSTGDYFRALQYDGCSNLRYAPEEYLLNTVQTIGQRCRVSQFYGCTSLTYAPEESLPDSVTSIGIYYRAAQYQGCDGIREIKGWKDRSVGNSYYRNNQFAINTYANTVAVKVLSNVGYSASNQGSLYWSVPSEVKVPSAYLNNFKNTENYPWVGMNDSKFIGY